MAGGKLSPRQKMINMMYLVLTALLAMNVSKEILNSFALLNNGLVKTNTNFSAKNEVTYANFETAELNDPNKVRPYNDKAKAVKKRSQEMFDYIENLKTTLITEVEQKAEVTIEAKNGQDSVVKIASDIMHMEGKDNNVVPTHYFMGEEDKASPNNIAGQFKEKVKNFKSDLMTFIPEKEKKNIRLGLEINDVWSEHEGMMITWESNNFYHNPAVAVIAILTKMQNDVKNAEADIINALYKQIDVSSFKFDTLSARVVANSNYVLLGDEYRAEIFMAAFSTTSNPQVWVGTVDSVKNEIVGTKDTASVKVNKGVGIYTTSPTAEGTYPLTGVIRMKDPADPAIIHSYPFKTEYKAARPAIVVSPDKMNVFYIGIDNPVSISVPGIAAEDLQPSMSGGSIGGSRGKYQVKVGQNMAGKEVTVNVSARTKNGVRSMGQGVKFRVKTVPNPVPTCYGKRGTDVIKAGEIQFIKGVVPMMDNFEFELKFPVVSFDVSMNVNGLEVTESTQGPQMSDKQRALIGRAKKGNKIYIEKVKVMKPGGIVAEIGSVNLKVL
jgi:gliding motility-associated protein GldM